MADTKPIRHALHPLALWGAVRAHPRVLVAAAIGIGVYMLMPGHLPGSVRADCAWIAGALSFLTGAVHTMVTSDHASIARRADIEDESRTIILALLLLAIAVNFISIVGVMSEAKQAVGTVRSALVILAASTLVVSWTVMQVVFAFHYTHEYYRPDDATDQQSHGLEFPGEETPDYWDFFYFATSIGAASQTADVAIRSGAMRKIVTAHAMVAFFFNSAILALTINLAASLV